MLSHNKEQEKIYRSGEFDDLSVREFFTTPTVYMTPASALPVPGAPTASAAGTAARSEDGALLSFGSDAMDLDSGGYRCRPG